MPSEAKYGLVVGVALIILIAVVFFRREAAQAKNADPASAAVKAPGSLTTPRTPQPVQREKAEGAKEERLYRPVSGVLPRQRPEWAREEGAR
jgi:hypothetical protein